VKFLEKENLDYLNNFVSRFYFIPKFFLINLFANIPILIFFIPPYPFCLKDLNLFILVGFLIYNFLIFLVIPFGLLKNYFKNASINFKKNDKIKSFNGKIILVLLISVIISVRLNFILVIFLDLSFKAYDIFFLFLGAYLGFFFGLIYSTFLLNKIIKKDNKYKNIINLASNENNYVKINENLPLFSLFEIDSGGAIKNHSIKRILVFLFYSFILCFFLFFNMIRANQNSILNSTNIILTELVGHRGSQNIDLSVYSLIEIVKIYFRMGVFGNLNFKIFLFLLYIPSLLVCLTVSLVSYYRPLKKQKLDFLKKLLSYN